MVFYSKCHLSIALYSLKSLRGYLFFFQLKTSCQLKYFDCIWQVLSSKLFFLPEKEHCNTIISTWKKKVLSFLITKINFSKQEQKAFYLVHWRLQAYIMLKILSRGNFIFSGWPALELFLSMFPYYYFFFFKIILSWNRTASGQF